MKIDSTIAITDDGKTNHNKLRLPEWELTDFYIKTPSKRSKCYRPVDAPISSTAAEGIDELNFAPEKENIEIHYHINDPTAQIKGGKLELFCRFNKKPLWSLDLEKLGEDWLKHGKHTVKWDGRIINSDQPISGTITDHNIEHSITSQAPDLNYDSKAFPDGFITLEHTPYKLRLTLTPKNAKIIGNPTSSWTYFHILIKKMEIKLAEEALIPAATVDDDRHKMDKALRAVIDTDGGVPASGQIRKINLISNLYKTSSAEMNDNSAFTLYKTLWDEGAQIPLILDVFIADSAGSEVKLVDSDKGAVVLGNTKFLWDWEDPDEDVAAQQNATSPYEAKPKAFIESAIDYYKAGTDTTRAAADHTYPKGDNCHVDRGGKRGPSAKPIAPDQPGYTAKDTLDIGKFPFKVEACKNRKWAAYSYGWNKGKLKGQTGIVFRPSRMAGDNYNLTVYLANDVSAKDTWVLDDKAEPLPASAKIKVTTGTWQVWREMHLSRYVRKLNSITAYLPTNMGAVQGIYDDAYINVVDKIDPSKNNYVINDHRKANGSAVDYNALAIAKINAANNPHFVNDRCMDRSADHSAEDSGLKTYAYDKFVQEMHLFLHSGTPAAANDISSIATANGMSVTDLSEALGSANFGAPPHTGAIARLVATQNYLVTNDFERNTKYSRWLDRKCFGILRAMVGDGANLGLISGAKTGETPGANDGVTIVHFNYSNTYLRDLVAAGVSVGMINGAAIGTSDSHRNACVFIFTNAMLDTFCHEIGHHMFLPHARYSTSASVPGGAQPNRHDDSDTNCLMSYNRPRHAFCGLCQLRLRGWDASGLSKISANNKKT